MVNVCCVKGCKSRSDCNKDLAFYHITKNSELRKKWLKGIKQPNLVVHDSTRICSAHFPNHRKTSDTDIPSKKHTRPRPLPQQSVPRRVVRRLDRRAEEIEQLIQECESTLPVAKRPWAYYFQWKLLAQWNATKIRLVLWWPLSPLLYGIFQSLISIYCTVCTLWLHHITCILCMLFIHQISMVFTRYTIVHSTVSCTGCCIFPWHFGIERGVI